MHKPTALLGSHGHCLRVSILILALLSVVPGSPNATSSTPDANANDSAQKAHVFGNATSRWAEASQSPAGDNYGNLPLYFEANRGQSDPRVKFLAHASRQTLFLTSTEAVLALTKQESAPLPIHGTAGPQEPTNGAALRMTFTGANPSSRVTGLEEMPGKANYFLGDDPTNWRTQVSTYAKVRYVDLYPGVDLIYYGTERQLEYDFVVRPGVDPTRIVFGIEGADRQEVDAEGDLILDTGAGPVRQKKPVIYQEVNGVRHGIAGGYVLTAAHQVTFRVGDYDVSRPLVIDPVLVYSTYLGDGAGTAIAVDPAGNVYLTGYTYSLEFPTTAGAFQTTAGGFRDVFVTKLNPAGTALIYSTYLGGSSYDTGLGISVDASGNAYVTGNTSSSDFPVTAGAFQTAFGQSIQDAFVTKLNPTGSSLLYSTFIGGDGFGSGNGIAIDHLGDAFVTGITSSRFFPTTAGAFQVTFGRGTLDAFVTKLNPAGAALVYSTFLGGSSDDFGNGIAVDAAGNTYVTGHTGSTDFPTTAGAFETTFSGPFGHHNPFVTKLDSAGSVAVYSTYLGDGESNAIAVNAAGNAFVTGITISGVPTTAGAFQTYPGGNGDVFVTKLNPTGSTLVYSTYLGGNGDDLGYGIAVDAAGNACVTGVTDSADFPTTPGGFQGAAGDFLRDAFVAKIDPAGSGLAYSTYLGGSHNDNASTIAVDAAGNAYVTGYTESTDFPTTAGAYQTNYGSTFIAKIAETAPPPPTTTGKVNGGGSINVPGGFANFGFMLQVRSAGGPITGDFQYLNHASGAQVQSVTFKSFVIAGATATFGGTCNNNGVPCTFSVQIQDNGEPGTNDTFSIAVDAGSPEGTNESLRSGNVVIH